jgi:hypothetical protein
MFQVSKTVINNSSGFPTCFLANQNIQKPWKAANKLIKISENYKFFESVSPEPREENFLNLKSWGPVKHFKPKSSSYSGSAYPYISKKN